MSHLGARETVELAILGAALNCSLEIDEIVGSVRQMVGTKWHPTSDVIVEGLRNLLSEGFVDIEPLRCADCRTREESDGRFHTSIAGRARLEVLLKMKISNFRTPPGSVCIGLKVCLLEVLRHDDRAPQIEELIELHEAEIGRLGEEVYRYQRAFGFVGQWLAHELECLRSEIAWLRELMPDVGG